LACNTLVNLTQRCFLKKLTTNSILFSSIIVLLIGIGFSTGLLFSNLPSPWRTPLEFSTKVTDKLGEDLRFFTTQDGFWRFPADLKNTDKRFISALINYEDKRFYQHAGVDIFALFRAVTQLLSNSQIISGASTLSMQTIRLLNPQPRTIKNKLLEMIQSFRMERELSKEKILLLYLNLAPYGGNIQGIEAASYFYFGKPPRHLSPSEIALLIALPQSPESRRPDRNKLRARAARNHVLQRQMENTLISKNEFQLAIQQPIKTTRQQTPFYAPHLTQRLHQLHPQQQIVRSSISLPLQILLELKIKQFRADLDSEQTIAVLVVDNISKEVVAHMGSADFFQDSQIDLSRVIRSPGSTLKPFIYGLGFEKKLFHPLTQVMDRRFRFEDGYAPQNFDHSYRGQVSLEKALIKSLNIPAVKALKRVGVNQFIQRLQSVGINLSWQFGQDAGLGIALGGSGLSLENLVAMYAALATAGKYHQLVYSPSKLQLINKQLLSPLANYYIDEILKKMPQDSQNNYGTLRYKTGTSYGYRDAWSIGYNSQYTIGVWVGRVDGGFTHNQTGSQIATPILKQLFSILPKKIYVRDDLYKNDHVLTSFQQLPVQMRWLENSQSSYRFNNQMEKPTILYPLDGSRIEITAIKQKNTGMLILKASGGESPYHWMINGQYLINTNSEIQWPVSKGKQKITLIDNQGRQNYSQIQVKIIKGTQ
jgi:penicillin-binding protein 1C